MLGRSEVAPLRSFVCTLSALALGACASAQPPGTRDEDLAGGHDGPTRDAGSSGRAAGGGDSGRVAHNPGGQGDAATWVVHSGDSAVDTRADGCGVLRARLRDFGYDHPDFEHVVNGRVIKQIVEPTLGADHKPVENASVSAGAGIQAFVDWYRDGPKNMSFELELALVEETPGHFVYDSRAFFPLDGRGFGNQFRDHNFSFSTEIHTRFVYRGGEQFTFAGDDDVWVFINGRLAIDLGGVHARETESVLLDERAGELEIELGRDYAMDIFHAERHSGESNFRIETTIDCITPVLVI